jgi:hypothetical protein
MHTASKLERPSLKSVCRALARVGTTALLFASAACGVLDPDLSPVSGVYRLESVDGKPLPFPLGEGSCPNAITSGEAGLAPRIANRKPLYSVNAYATLLCDPSRIVFGEENPLHDAGGWTYDDPEVHFGSNQGFGDYSIKTEPGDPHNTVDVVLRFNLGGRVYLFRRYDAHP